MYEVLGNKPKQEALALIVRRLTVELSDEQINQAVDRMINEWRPKSATDFVRLVDLREAVGASAGASEAHKAWQLVMDFAGKYIAGDCHGYYAPSQGVRSVPMPNLSQRILDVVRITGGWRIYKQMSEEDFPFVRERFLEEYRLWSNVQAIDESRMLTPGGALKELKAATKLELPEKSMAAVEPTAAIRRPPPPIELWTPEEKLARQASLKADLAAWKDRGAK